MEVKTHWASEIPNRVLALLLVAQIFYIVTLFVPAHIASNRLFLPEARFFDWYHVFTTALQAEPYGHSSFGPAAYPAPVYLLGKLIGMPFLQLGLSATAASILAYLCIVTTSSIFLIRSLSQIADKAIHHAATNSCKYIAALTLLFSYPFVFALDRGNIEIFSFLAVSLYVSSYISSEHLSDLGTPAKRSSVRRLLYLAIGATLKPYVLIFILLECRKEKKGIIFLRILSVAAIVTALNLLSVAILYRGNLMEGLISARAVQQDFIASYVIGESGSHFFSGPYVLLKHFFAGALGCKPSDFFHYYILVSGIVACIILGKLWSRRSSISIGNILFTSAAIILAFPHLANDYKSIYFILPFLAISAPLKLKRHPLPNTSRPISGRLYLKNIHVRAATTADRILSSDAALIVLSGSFLVNKNILTMTAFHHSVDLGWIIGALTSCISLIAATLANDSIKTIDYEATKSSC